VARTTFEKALIARAGRLSKACKSITSRRRAPFYGIISEKPKKSFKTKN
jgi:hypothetical protein